MDKEIPKSTPFDNQMISLFSINNLTNNTDKFIEIQMGNTKVDIGYNDQEGINNYKYLQDVRKINVSKIYDQSGNNNDLFQNVEISQPKIDTYLEFSNNSAMYFVDTSKFYDRKRFTIALNVILEGDGNIFKYGDLYSIVYKNNYIQFIIGEKIIYNYEYKESNNIFIAWTYLNDMITSNIMINDYKTEIYDSTTPPYSDKEKYDAILGGFNGKIYSFGAWNWNLLASQLNYIKSKF